MTVMPTTKESFDQYTNKRKEEFRQAHRFYGLWASIKNRCSFRSPGYKNYGGRGIHVFHEWCADYHIFESWILENIGERPSRKHSLDRIDNDGNYEPGNLRWATQKEQANNRRPRLFIADVLNICQEYVSQDTLKRIEDRLKEVGI